MKRHPAGNEIVFMESRNEADKLLSQTGNDEAAPPDVIERIII